MNARVPLEVSGSSAAAYDTVARASNEVAGPLASRQAAVYTGDILL
jgi:hypothetical protein